MSASTVQRVDAASHAVKLGDVLTVALDRTVRVLKVVGFAERRGPAEAATLCEDLAPPPAPAPTAPPACAMPAPVGRPNAIAARSTGCMARRDLDCLDNALAAANFLVRHACGSTGR